MSETTTHTTTMTPRQRWRAALDLEPVDRLPFWPKLGGNYLPAQVEPFRSMSWQQIHQWIGADCHEGIGSGVRWTHDGWTVENSETEVDGRKIFHHLIRGPGGAKMTSSDTQDIPSASTHPLEFPVKTPDDIKRLTDFHSAWRTELDEEGLAAAVARATEIGETASTMTCIGTSPMMDWVQHLAGPLNAHYFLADCRDDVRALFEAMHANLVSAAKLIAEHNPADTIYMIENTSSTLISPQQYADYCFDYVSEYGRICRARGRRLTLHMCGHLKALLEQLANVPAAAFEAFTSPTLGSTTLLDGRTACPNVCLIGGTNAPLWTQPAARIIATLQRDLDELPHHRGLVITSAGVMPPAATPETIKRVADFVHAYPARMD